jgi:Radical SAM superfamily
MTRPVAIRLEASSFCQLRCPSCPTTTGAIHPAVGSGFLKLSDFCRLLDGSPELRHIELSNYGEIFLNPDLGNILAEAHRRGVSLSCANGANLNHVRPELLEAVVRYGLRAITCSIDGASDQTYRQYRRRGNFDRVIANLREINGWKQALASPYPVLIVIFGHNEHEIPLARRVARELGMTFRTKLSWDPDFSPVRDKQKVRQESGVGAATREEYREREGVDLMQGICHQLWDQPQVNWDGKLLGCCRNFWGDFGGNAFRDGLAACLGNEKIAHARRVLRGQTSARDDIPCTTCEIYLGMRASGRWLRRSATPEG